MFVILEDETTTGIERFVKLYSETNRVHAVTLTHVGNKMLHGTRRNVFAAVIEYYPKDEDEVAPAHQPIKREPEHIYDRPWLNEKD